MARARQPGDRRRRRPRHPHPRQPRLTGHFLIDEEVLRGAGVTDFSRYADVPDADLLPDFFL